MVRTGVPPGSHQAKKLHNPYASSSQTKRKQKRNSNATVDTEASSDDAEETPIRSRRLLVNPYAKKNKKEPLSISAKKKQRLSLSSHQEIIELLDNDSDDNNTSNNNNSVAAAALPLEDDSDIEVLEDYVPPPASPKKKSPRRLDLKKPPPAAASSQNNDEDDVQVLDAEQFRPVQPVAAAASTGNDNDEELEVVGTRGTLRLPHARQHCLEIPFQASPSDQNQTHCNLCYCYVCDRLVQECTEWNQHCHATDKSHHWKTLRLRKRQERQGGTASATASAMTAAPSARAARTSTSQRASALATSVLRALAQPSSRGSAVTARSSISARASALAARIAVRAELNAGANTDPLHGNAAPFHDFLGPAPSNSKCRHCKGHATSGTQIHRAWCAQCGRIWKKTKSDSTTVYAPFVPETPEETFPPTVYLGSKTMAFTLHVHDPREMQRFQNNWNQNQGKDGWEYDEGLAQEDFFKSVVGRRPNLSKLVHLLSVLPKDNIPRDVTDGVSPEELQAVILSDPKDITLLSDLSRCASEFGGRGHEMVAGNLSASFDRSTLEGSLKVRVYLNPSKCTRAPLDLRRSLTEFMGSWYGIFPFKLSELAGRHEAEVKDLADYEEKSYISVPPFEVKGDLLNDCRETINSTRTNLVDEFNNAVQTREASLSLESGDGNKLGGICNNETDLRGVMKRYYREVVADGSPGDFYSIGHSFRHFVETQHMGVLSLHRTTQRGTHHHHQRRLQSGIGTQTSFLSPVDYASWKTDHKKSHENHVNSLDTLMKHCENLGHEAAPQVEGITVDLLPFQLQTLKWAQERENNPGGLEACLWTKLPSVRQHNTEVYFNPILGKFTTQKPKLVRGGLIAEQMGLGKTVITLALILTNPAPALPLSGGKFSSIEQNPNRSTGSFWDPEIDRTGKNGQLPLPKRGHIISRGCLVVCNVSLVGQWMAEAKSKLADPGLLHAYHGGSRVRDPKKLSKYSIVVTTYETLASDDVFHRNKSANSNTYCSPCEQIAWWRIVCDEAHNLKAANSSKYDAVMKIVAQNRWLVTGTPVSSTLEDLPSQLKFLGLEKVTDYFADFKNSVYHKISDKGVPRKKRRGYQHQHSTELAPFVAFMRTIMMRHSHNQTYKNTNTTLMSLPKKTMSTVFCALNQSDKKEYKQLEEAAQGWYQSFRGSHGQKLSRHYLTLQGKLQPMRIACAGGKIPVGDTAPAAEDEDSLGSDDDENETPKPKKSRAVQFGSYEFTSKFETLIKELEKVRENDETSKCLIFSQYTSTLDWLAQELPSHGFQYRTLKGSMSMRARSKALEDFQNDPPTTIFLLSLRAGACGLNLTAANRVFLMDVSMNPAIEAQAIGRVHRLGQQRPVQITRLVIPDSVETRLIKLLEGKYGSTDYDQGNQEENVAKADDAKSENSDSSEPTSAASTEMWTCPSCSYTQNDDDECLLCDTAKPATKPVEPEEDDRKMPAKKTKNDNNKKKDDDRRLSSVSERIEEEATKKVAVGSLRTDKVQMVTEEFDLLFNYTAPPIAAAAAAVAAAAAPDPFGYSSFDDEDDYAMPMPVKSESSSANRFFE